MPPLISSTGIPPGTLQGGVGVGRQLKVTARCHTTVQSHYPSRRLKRCSPPSRDGQMTIIPRSIVSLGLLISRMHLFLRFAPIYILKSVKLHCWLKVSNYDYYLLFSYQNFFLWDKQGFVIVFCFSPAIFIFWVHNCTELLIYSTGSGRRGWGSIRERANGLFVFTMGREDGKGDLGRQRGLLLLTANLQQTGH